MVRIREREMRMHFDLKKIAASIIMGDHRTLWNKARKFRKKSNTIPAVIDGETGAGRLAQLFTNKSITLLALIKTL